MDEEMQIDRLTLGKGTILIRMVPLPRVRRSTLTEPAATRVNTREAGHTAWARGSTRTGRWAQAGMRGATCIMGLGPTRTGV